MTLLAIVQNACDQIGVRKPSAVVGSSDETAIRALALANIGGKLLARWGAWTVLQKEHTFSTVASTASYAPPSDFDRMMSETAWDRTNFWAMRGPLSPQLWQQFKSGLVANVGIVSRFRIKASSNARLFFIDPTPTSVLSLVFEYVSNAWCQSSGGTARTAWAADTDTGILDEALLELDLRWRLTKAFGMDWQADYAEFKAETDTAFARDDGLPVLDLVRPHGDPLLAANVPDTGYGA